MTLRSILVCPLTHYYRSDQYCYRSDQYCYRSDQYCLGRTDQTCGRLRHVHWSGVHSTRRGKVVHQRAAGHSPTWGHMLRLCGTHVVNLQVSAIIGHPSRLDKPAVSECREHQAQSSRSTVWSQRVAKVGQSQMSFKERPLIRFCSPSESSCRCPLCSRYVRIDAK